jgi:secondary thiamine-phosphate synthase enzyme
MKTIEVSTTRREELLDITHLIENVIQESDINDGLCHIFVPHATSGVIINENDDPNITLDFLDVMKSMAPRGSFRHDRIDGNGDAHVKSAIVSASETVPFHNSELLLGTWQSIMICEFDGPRKRRKIIVTIIPE